MYPVVVNSDSSMGYRRKDCSGVNPMPDSGKYFKKNISWEPWHSSQGFCVTPTIGKIWEPCCLEWEQIGSFALDQQIRFYYTLY